MPLSVVEPRRKRVVSDDLLTPDEFARRLRVTRARVYKWIQRGHLRVHQFGPDSHPTYLISAKEVESDDVRQLIRRGMAL